MSFYQLIIRPLLFLLPSERAHHFTIFSLKFLLRIPLLNQLLKRSWQIKNPNLEKKILGLHFPNPIGLAAGFDKDAKVYEEMSALGFGFIEIGTVTPKPQSGNPKPRLFRLKKDNGLINRMGFNNDGVVAAVKRLKGKDKNIIIGGNIGKNKVTPNEFAEEDYRICFEALHPYVDYFVINVSSPNTPGLRALQETKALQKIIRVLTTKNNQLDKPLPILLKIAPDMSFEQLDEIIDLCIAEKLAGIIATNTTTSRTNLCTPIDQIEAIGNGGLSGQPLNQKSTQVIKHISDRCKGKLVIIGVGGISNPQDAIDKINAGADLIQLYTGLIYEGPSLIKRINKAIIEVI